MKENKNKFINLESLIYNYNIIFVLLPQEDEEGINPLIKVWNLEKVRTLNNNLFYLFLFSLKSIV